MAMKSSAPHRRRRTQYRNIICKQPHTPPNDSPSPPQTTQDEHPLDIKMPVPMHTRPARILRSQSPLTAEDSPCQKGHNFRVITPCQCNASHSPPTHLQPAFSFDSTVTLDPAELSATPDPVAVAEITRVISHLPRYQTQTDVIHCNLGSMIEALAGDGMEQSATVKIENHAQVKQETMEEPWNGFKEEKDDEVKAELGQLHVKKEIQNMSELTLKWYREDEPGSDFDAVFRKLEDSGLE